MHPLFQQLVVLGNQSVFPQYTLLTPNDENITMANRICQTVSRGKETSKLTLLTLKLSVVSVNCRTLKCFLAMRKKKRCKASLWPQEKQTIQ